ncbi:MAG: RNA polymerase recycling motor HelD [Eubacteriales bacterium]
MSLKEHADYLPEKRRLEETVDYVNKTIEENIEKKNIIKEDIIEEFGNMDRADSAQSYQRVALNATLYDMAAMQYKALIKASQKPYFCRIDIKQQDSSETKKFYIGKIALVGEDIENPLIVDWRAPVSSVYYDGRLGEVTYDAPGGLQHADLYLKRQYTINKAALENIIDVDITATDAFLQAVLGENKDKRLQDIVSTIQAEQNKIIRADIYSPVIVQGAAGSGKTTIALHRIAYLIYTFNQAFYPGDFLIIAPNRLFLNYISEVLPELGVEHVRQSTFIDLTYELLNIKHKLINSDEKLVKFISHGNIKTEETELTRRICEFKSSLKFRDMIDHYTEYLANEFITGQDFTLGEYTILPAGDIRRMFNNALSGFPLYKRIPLMKKSLQDLLKEKTVVILKKIDSSYEQRIQYIRDNTLPSEGRREKIVALFDERDEKLQYIKKASRSATAKYFAALPKKDLITHYKELVTDPENMLLFSTEPGDSEFTVKLCEHNTALLRKSTIEYEDLAALLYLKHKLYGFENNTEIKYVVIDEAQDFSLFQLYTLKEVFRTELFTLLGDLAQGIHSYRGIRDWNDVTQLFPAGRCKFMTLEQSYRTTVEIMNAANEVLKLSSIPGLVPAKPVVRYGDKPCLYKYLSKDTLIKELAVKLNDLKSKEYKTIAVICKTAAECSEVKQCLEKTCKIDIKQLSTDDLYYEGGTVIVPSYQTKGLEFDAVIICTLSEDYLPEELDIKLLYVAMTRALHCLDFICLDNKMSLLDDITGIVHM